MEFTVKTREVKSPAVCSTNQRDYMKTEDDQVVAAVDIPAPAEFMVRADFVKAAYEFAADGDIRYYLNGVHVRPHPEKGVVIEASNGHHAAMFHDVNGTCTGNTIIRLNKAGLTAIKKTGNYHVQLNDGKLSILCNSGEVYIQPGKPDIEGKFPDLPKLLTGKTFKTGMHSLVNFNYIEPCKLKAVSSYSAYGCALKFWQQVPAEGERDDYGLIIVRNDSVPEFICLVMPMRDDFLEAVPDWCKSGKAAVEAEAAK